MKKFLSVIIVCMLLLVFASCGEKKETEVQYYETFHNVSPTREGVFYCSPDDDLLHMRTVDTSEDIIMCYDPNCAHEPASADNLDPTCKATLFLEGQTHVVCYDGYLYYFNMVGLRETNIYKMEVGGSGRTHIATIPYRANPTQAVTIYNDKMYFIVFEISEPDSNGKLEQKQYIMEYDLTSNEYRLASNNIENDIFYIQLTKEYIYLKGNNSNGDMLAKRIDKETLEEAIFITSEEYKTCRMCRAYDDYYIYYDGFGIVGMRYLDGREDRILIDSDEKIVPTVSGNVVFYHKAKEEEVFYSVVGGCYYDILTGETIDISEKVMELDIIAYDDYNEVFLCNGLYNTSAMSKDAILASGTRISE